MKSELNTIKKSNKKYATEIASVTIRNAENMTGAERRAISNWLRKRAASLEKEGHNYARTFRARYYEIPPDTVRLKRQKPTQAEIEAE